MCDCIERLEEQALERMEAEAGQKEIKEEPKFENKSWLFEQGLIVLSNNIVGRYRWGKSIRKFEKRFMPNYCPFCGEKLIKDKEK